MNRRQWVQCVAVAATVIAVSMAAIVQADEASATAAQGLCDTAIKAATEAKERAADRIAAEGIDPPEIVQSYVVAGWYLDGGGAGIVSAKAYQKLGNKKYFLNLWAGAELFYLGGAVQGDRSYDIYESIYPDQGPDM